MKQGKLTLLLAILLIFTLLTGCAKDVIGDPGTAVSLTVTDMRDRKVMFDKPIEKVVALTAADCEILYAIGAGSMLVGRGEFCNYPEEIAQVPTVQSGSETNIEQVIALEPQVVIMSAMAQSVEQVEALENAGIKVVVTDANNINGVYTAIALIGEIAGKKQEAADLIDNMKRTFAEVSEKASGDGTKTIYFEVSPLEFGLWAAGTGTFMDEISTMLGLKNAFSDISGWGEVSQEQVIERNPDYIVTTLMYFGEGPEPIDEILSRDGWQDITALKNAGIINSDGDAMTRPGPRLAEAAKILYSVIYENDAA